MALAFPEPAIVRPTCPLHPDSRVLLDGYTRSRWSDAHRRPRYRCVTEAKSRGHVFFLPIPVRQPSDHHPDSGRACPHCEHIYARHEGTKTGAGFVFGHQEIARLFLRVGEGMSLRKASGELRESIFRVNHRDPAKAPLKRIRPGQTSQQANLAVNYLDAYAPAIIDKLHPKCWPAVIVIDSTTLMTSGYRRTAAKDDAEPGAKGDSEKAAGNLKAGTIMVAFDPTGPSAKPCLIQVQGGKDVDSWKAFFASLEDSPEWVIADLDPAIARAVRETWPKAILYHSRRHLAELMRKHAIADGVPDRVRLDEPIRLARPIPWSKSRSTMRRWGDHPLMTAIAEAQRGPEEWARLKELIAVHVEPDKLALRAWLATNEILIQRQWKIRRIPGHIPLSTGSLEGRMSEWVAPLRRRAGRWQNARRLNLALGLITLRGRGEAHEARYAGIIRTAFEASGNRSHLPVVMEVPIPELEDETRPMSWWRTWQDHDEASLPRLVFDSERRTRQRADDDHVRWLRERLAGIYAAQNDLRKQFGIPSPPSGRPKRPERADPASLKGRFVTDLEDLMLEWDWDLNGDLNPRTVAAGGKQRVAWRCLLNPDHVWETRASSRTYGGSCCPYHMGNKVHPSESLAAYFPGLAKEWHPTKNVLRADQVTRASARQATWICELGHEWPAVIYSRTLSQSGCPECHKLTAPERNRVARQRGRQQRDQRAAAQIASLIPLDELDADMPF